MTRLRPSGIMPLELWDLRVRDGILWDYMRLADFGRVLHEALTGVWEGIAETRSEGKVHREAAHFDSIYLSGGGVLELGHDLRTGPWRNVFTSNELQYAGEAGGMALLKGLAQYGWVMDLGQSSLKISTDGRRWTWPRDFGQLPIRTGGEKEELKQRQELRDFLSHSLQICCQMSRRKPEAILCALPSRLDDDGVPEGSSYIGMKGDKTLLPETLAAAGLNAAKIFVVNDAELAAASAQLDEKVQGRTLSLTIGFGVGAALILPV